MEVGHLFALVLQKKTTWGCLTQDQHHQNTKSSVLPDFQFTRKIKVSSSVKPKSHMTWKAKVKGGVWQQRRQMVRSCWSGIWHQRREANVRSSVSGNAPIVPFGKNWVHVPAQWVVIMAKARRWIRSVDDKSALEIVGEWLTSLAWISWKWSPM